jgi:hypothetical protein
MYTVCTREVRPEFAVFSIQAFWEIPEGLARRSGIPDLNSKNFTFDLYSSGEYTRMLERSWGE